MALSLLTIHYGEGGLFLLNGVPRLWLLTFLGAFTWSLISLLKELLGTSLHYETYRFPISKNKYQK